MQGTHFTKCVVASQLVFRSLPVNSFTPRYFKLGATFRHIASSPVYCSVLNKTIPQPLKASNLFLSSSHTSKLLAQRKFSGIPQDFGGSKTLERLHRKDGIPKSYTLIYRTNFPNYLMFSQMFVLLAIGATITTGLILLTGGLTEEQKEEKKAKQLEEVQQRKLSVQESPAMKALQEYKDEQGIKEPTSKPQVEDLLEGDGYQMAAMTMFLITMGISLFRIQRFLPVRIYANQKVNYILKSWSH